MEEHIKQKLTQALEIQSLAVINESHKHKGNAGDDGSGESHFHLRVVSSDFSGKSRVERHQMVHDALKEYLSSRIHALSLELRDK